MAYIRNANFDPTDRNSRRFIEVPDSAVSNAPLAVATPAELAGNKFSSEMAKPVEAPAVPKDTTGASIDAAPETKSNFNPEQLASLAGKAGLSVNEFQSLLEQGSKVSQTQRDKFETAAGIPSLIESVYNTPSVKTQDLFNQLYNSVGLQSVKARIEQTNKDIAAEKERFISSKQAHQNNPWISQETRNAKIARERSISNERLAALAETKQADVDLFNQGLDQIESEVSRASADTESDRTLNANKLEFLLRRVDQQVSDKESANLADSLRYVPDFLKSQISGSSSGSGASAMGATAFGDSGVGLASPRVITPVPTFDDWINKQQQAKGMSFTPAYRESLRSQYDQEVSKIKQNNQLAQEARSIARLSPEARSVVKNPSLFFDSFTPTKKQAILAELEQAGIDTTAIARGKKKSVSSTTADDLTQARLAKENMIEIGQLIEELGAQGPVIGRVRQQNPYDDNVVRLNNLIKQAVPGLARGIFKEVGVLTDTDVARYTSTIANPNLTKDQAIQATQDILNKIDTSIKLQVETLDSLGYEVGNFSDLMGGTGASSSEQAMSDDEAYSAYLKMVNK